VHGVSVSTLVYIKIVQVQVTTKVTGRIVAQGILRSMTTRTNIKTLS